jgi:hypothetical protein
LAAASSSSDAGRGIQPDRAPPAGDAPQRVVRGLPELTKRNRGMALAVLLLAQTACFFIFLQRPPHIFPPDNFRYFVPGWNLAEGRGLSMPFAMAPDPVVRGWVCARHPDACNNPEGRYPTALYPPGYSYFVAGVALVAGRSVVALAAVHWVLLLLLFVLFERMAGRLLRPAGYWFVLAVACVYPFLARQATWFMSDHLHSVLLLAGLAALYLLQPGAKRAALFGGLLAMATLVRPYSLFGVAILLLGGACWRAFQARRSEPWIALGAAGVFFLAWTLRNGYWYGRFIPLTTMGMGASLYSFVLEHEVGSIYSAANHHEYARRLYRHGDWIAREANAKLTAETWAWMKEHPGPVVALAALHVPKVWISLGVAGKGVSPASLVLVTYLGGLLLLGLGGMLVVRRDRRWWPMMIIIVMYWGILLVSPEARRTLPLRLPMLLLGGIAVQRLLEPWLARRFAAAVLAPIPAPELASARASQGVLPSS